MAILMFVDSHCHLDFPDFAADMPAVLAAMAAARVTHALCISVNLPDWPAVRALAEAHAHLYATVGVHPDYEDTPEPSVDDLVALAGAPRIVAIGETGLDYYRLTGDLAWQRERFRTHIRAAHTAGSSSNSLGSPAPNTCSARARSPIKHASITSRPTRRTISRPMAIRMLG